MKITIVDFVIGAFLILLIFNIPLLLLWKYYKKEPEAQKDRSDLYQVNGKVLFERKNGDFPIVIHDKDLAVWFLKNYPLYGVEKK